jgi:hypothetical protein
MKGGLKRPGRDRLQKVAEAAFVATSGLSLAWFSLPKRGAKNPSQVPPWERPPLRRDAMGAAQGQGGVSCGDFQPPSAGSRQRYPSLSKENAGYYYLYFFVLKSHLRTIRKVFSA